jgi:hypothetical protein
MKTSFISQHVWTPEDIELLRSIYKPYTDSSRELSEKIGCTENAVRSKATRLGLTTRPKLWTFEEEERLKELAALYPVRRISRIMHRSEYAIATRLSRLKFSILSNRDGWYSVRDVGMIFGVEIRWVYSRIQTGKLKSSDHYSKQQKKKIAMHHISRKNLISFIRSYTGELQGLRPDMYLFVDLLSGLKRTESVPYTNIIFDADDEI